MGVECFAAASADHVLVRISAPSSPNLSFSVYCSRHVGATESTSQPPPHLVLPHGATVGNLKDLIQRLYPGAPSQGAQRLIFAGSILDDSRIIVTDVFKKSDLSEPQTIHLVVKESSPEQTMSNLRHRHNVSSRSRSPDSTQNLQSDSNARIMSSTIEATAPSSLRSRVEVSSNLSLQSLAQMYQLQLQQSFAAAASAMPVQVVVINGIPYALQMNPLLVQNQSFTGAQSISCSYLAQNAILPPQAPLNQGNGAPVVEPVAGPRPQPRADLPQAAAPPPPPALAAGGGGALGFMQQDNDDEFGDGAGNGPPNPIWLLMKLGFMVWMFSQHASLTRFIILNVLACIIFVVQMGWFRFNFFVQGAAVPAPVDPVPVAPVPPVAPAVVGSENSTGNQVPTDQPPASASSSVKSLSDDLVEQVKTSSDPESDLAPNAASGDSTASPENASMQPPRPTLLEEFRTLVYTFVTSLVPEHNDGLAA